MISEAKKKKPVPPQLTYSRVKIFVDISIFDMESDSPTYSVRRVQICATTGP